jgi:hypothetical protein
LLSKAVGRPVRVQGMRYEGHGWDPKGPASIHRARAALDKDGLVIGYVLESKGFSRIDIDTNESDPSYSLAGRLMGLPLKSLQGFGVPTESYGFAVVKAAAERAQWDPRPSPRPDRSGDTLSGRRDGVARALGLPQDKVHGIWVPGPGSYGRNDAGDAGIAKVTSTDWHSYPPLIDYRGRRVIRYDMLNDSPKQGGLQPWPRPAVSPRSSPPMWRAIRA